MQPKQLFAVTESAIIEAAGIDPDSALHERITRLLFQYGTYTHHTIEHTLVTQEAFIETLDSIKDDLPLGLAEALGDALGHLSQDTLVDLGH